MQVQICFEQVVSVGESQLTSSNELDSLCISQAAKMDVRKLNAIAARCIDGQDKLKVRAFTAGPLAPVAAPLMFETAGHCPSGYDHNQPVCSCSAKLATVHSSFRPEISS